MTSRETQDVILRLLADAPYRAAPDHDAARVLARVDGAALDRFGRFLCRHYYRERVVHYFKYARALAPLTGRAPEAALKTPEFNALMPNLVLGERAGALRVLELLRRFLADDTGAIQAKVPYWDDLVTYQGVFFASDALPPTASSPAATRFPARAETASIVELNWDLPAVLPKLLCPFDTLPIPPRQPIRLLFARSAQGEVTALRCTGALQSLLDNLTGHDDPRDVAARLGLDPATLGKTMERLEEIGAIRQA